MINQKPNPLVLADYLICTNCIGESYLKEKIEQSGEQSECSYCGTTGYIITIGELADRVDSAFDKHFVLTSTEPTGFEYAMLSDRESSYYWERHGEPVVFIIMEAANIEEEPAEHIRQVLEERNFDLDGAKAGEENPYEAEAHYEEGDVEDYELQHDWKLLQNSLKNETRLFNREAEAILESIFEGLAGHKTFKDDSVIVDAGPERSISKLYRARVFQSDEKLAKALENSDREMGSPPFSSAAAGRMNAQGISVFYGSTAPEVALAEIRPPVGSSVVVACFNLIRPLRLLNVEALREIYVDGSIFDSSYGYWLEKAKFLKRLSNLITLPAMPEFETSDYLITQAISDYLANLATPELDGIIYRSIQTGSSGLNVAFFWKSSCVEKLEYPKGTEIEVSLHGPGLNDEEMEPSYDVWEKLPENNYMQDEKVRHVLFERSLDSYILGQEKESRTPTLKLDVESMVVHHIKSISVETRSYPISRYRTNESTDEF